MLLFHLVTLNKITKAYWRVFVSHWRLVHSGEAPDGVMSLLAVIWIDLRFSLLAPGLDHQHVVLDRGKVVTALFRKGHSILMWISSLTPRSNHFSSTAIILTPSMST